MRKATKKESDRPVAPKKRAITISLIKPRIRLSRVADEKREADLVILLFAVMGLIISEMASLSSYVVADSIPRKGIHLQLLQLFCE